MMSGKSNLYKGLKPVILMVFVQVAYAAVNIIYKLAIKDGMNMPVANAYRLIFASAVTIPLAFIFDRLMMTPCIFLLLLHSLVTTH